MRLLIKLNNLLVCSQSPIFKSNRHFRLCLPAKAFITGTNRQLNALNSVKSYPKFAFTHHVQRFISIDSPKNRSNGANAAKDPDHESNGVSVYEGKFTRQIIRVKMFSLTTSAMGLMAQPLLWHKGLEVSGTGLSVLICSIAGIFTFVTPVLLHFVTKKYVIDIKYNEKTDEYTCITVSFFLFRNEIKFKVDDIEIPNIETMFTSMKIGSKKVPVFVDAASFTDTHHYARFMGYDKPLDFRLDVDEINNHSTASSDKVKASSTPHK